MVAYLNNNGMLTNYVLALYILSFFPKATKLATYSLIGIAYNYILITLPKELHYKVSRHNFADCCYSDLSEFFDKNLSRVLRTILTTTHQQSMNSRKIVLQQPILHSNSRVHNNLKIDGKIPVGSPSIVSHIFSVSSSIFSSSVGFISIFFASM
jgi:hypothetical protein